MSLLEKLKALYRWNHITRDDYLREYAYSKQQLEKLIPPKYEHPVLDRLADFLFNIAQAWRQATQEQRNKLAKALFEQLWIEDNKVVFVKPRTELLPFFKINFECHTKNIGYDPDGIRTHDLHRDRVAC